MSKIPKIIGALLAALGIAGIITASMATPSLIVSIGVRAISTLKIVSIITACVGGGVFALGFVPNVVNLISSSNKKKMIKGKVEERKKTFDEYARDSLNPVKTRERLDDIKENNASLSPIVDKCINQMDRMDKLQDRYKMLLDANDAIYLNNTVPVIDDAETRLCRNIRNIINCCILVEDGSSELSDFDRQIIERAEGVDRRNEKLNRQREPLTISYRALARDLHGIILPKLLKIHQYSCGALTTSCRKSSALLHDIGLSEAPKNELKFN